MFDENKALRVKKFIEKQKHSKGRFAGKPFILEKWQYEDIIKPLYLPNDNEWEVKKRGIKYKINPEVVSMGLAMRSLYLITKYIPLSDSEAQAIAYHDGQYINDNKVIAHKEEPLTLLLHWADYWTAHIYEEVRESKEDNKYYDREVEI